MPSATFENKNFPFGSALFWSRILVPVSSVSTTNPLEMGFKVIALIRSSLISPEMEGVFVGEYYIAVFVDEVAQ